MKGREKGATVASRIFPSISAEGAGDMGVVVHDEDCRGRDPLTDVGGRQDARGAQSSTCPGGASELWGTGPRTPLSPVCGRDCVCVLGTPPPSPGHPG